MKTDTLVHLDRDQDIEDVVSGRSLNTRVAAGRPDRHDQAMVVFATSWQHYGGGSSSDIFEQFGMTESAYFRRLHQLVHDGRFQIEMSTRCRIASICAKRTNLQYDSGDRASAQ